MDSKWLLCSRDKADAAGAARGAGIVIIPHGPGCGVQPACYRGGRPGGREDVGPILGVYLLRGAFYVQGANFSVPA